MDSHAWRRELDKLSELKSLLVMLNPSAEEKLNLQVRSLYDVYARFSKLENDMNSAGFLKKRKIGPQLEKASGQFEEDFMRVTRDFAELFRQQQKEIIAMIPKLQQLKPREAKALSTLNFPSVGSGDLKDLQLLYAFTKEFSKQYQALHQDISREVKSVLDENKRTVETYERHVSIDRSDVTTTVSYDEVSHLPLADLIPMMEKLKAERTYLDGRKDEVGRMIGTTLMSDIESVQTSVETAARFGLELPMDFTQKLRVLARDASRASNLTTLLSLENQLDAARQQVANLLRDRIINMQHELTSKIASGGIPTTSDIIPPAPTVASEGGDLSSLLSSYQKMVEWKGQVGISLKHRVEETLDDIEKATDAPEDTGISDVVSVREYLAKSKKELETAEIDVMIKIYLKAKAMDDEQRQHVKEKIREYLTRFNELATSADRVLDYAQLSKKAPKVDELEGSIVYLLQSLVNLRTAVEDGVSTFRDACGQEIDVIIQDLQTIKPAYAEIFMPIIVDLEDGSERIKKMEEFAQIRSEMRTIKDSILAKAQESLENLRYRLGVKIRLAAAKLMGAGVEIPKEVQDAISELNSIGIVADTVFSLPAIARKMIELYEKKISNKVIESLMERVDSLTDSFERAKSIGVNVDKELKVLGKLKKKPPTELEEAAESFDMLMNLTTSSSVHKRIRGRADDAYAQIKDAISIFEEQGMSEFVERLNTLIEQVPIQLEEESKHVTQALEVCLTLANVQEEMLTVIKSMAEKDSEKHEKEVREKSEYYSTIEAVIEKHQADFSKIIYPIAKIKELEKQVGNAILLDEAIEAFNELMQHRADWVEKAEKMDDWHKSLRMFMTGFSPAASAEERDKFIEDAIRKIRETYSREDISSYLTWAIREVADRMVGKRG